MLYLLSLGRGWWKRSGRVASSQGFSLVELLIALFFVGVLMAGMATVFKSSISVFTTSGERIGSGRRNRASLDMLNDDLNTAAQFLLQMDRPAPWVSDSAPCFSITPGVNFTDSDTLSISFDEVLPYSGTATFTNLRNQEQMVASGTLISDSAQPTLTFADSDQADKVLAGQYLIYKDGYEPKLIASRSPAAGGGAKSFQVTFDASATDEKGSFTGNTGPLNMYVHKTGTAVMVVNPRQTVTYYVANKSLDPEGGSTIPCLIRNQGGSEIIVADNIQRMKVAVSLDNGVTWHPDLASSQVQTWAQIKSSINADLASQNRQGFTTINSTPAWVRELPMLVRLDLTSLTSKARAEYSSDGKSLQKRETTQSLIIMPRYFGLSYF